MAEQQNVPTALEVLESARASVRSIRIFESQNLLTGNHARELLLEVEHLLVMMNEIVNVVAAIWTLADFAEQTGKYSVLPGMIRDDCEQILTKFAGLKFDERPEAEPEEIPVARGDAAAGGQVTVQVLDLRGVDHVPPY